MKCLLAIAACAAVGLSLLASPAEARVRVIRTPFRPRVGPIVIQDGHHAQRLIVVPGSTVVAPHGFYGQQLIVPSQPLIIVR